MRRVEFELDHPMRTRPHACRSFFDMHLWLAILLRVSPLGEQRSSGGTSNRVCLPPPPPTKTFMRRAGSAEPRPPPLPRPLRCRLSVAPP